MRVRWKSENGERIVLLHSFCKCPKDFCDHCSVGDQKRCSV